MIDKEKKAIDLSLAVYRITKLFPEKEALIFQMRETANEILKQITLKEDKKAVKIIEVLLNYFKIAKSQKWTKDVNFVILEREYNKVLESLNKSKRKGNKDNFKNKVIFRDDNQKDLKINHRQKEIINYLEKNKIAKGSDIIGLFSGISGRTTRNDLKDLVEKNLLIYWRDGRNCFYRKNQYGN